jgi:transcriptional regulator GlxA family with amidase domain
LMASIILGHPEAHPARVSRLVGFGSLEAMDHAFANSGMPTPEQLRRRIRGP